MKWAKIKPGQFKKLWPQVELDEEGDTLRGIELWLPGSRLRIERLADFSAGLKILQQVEGEQTTRWRVKGEKQVAGVPVVAAQVFPNQSDTREFARELEGQGFEVAVTEINVIVDDDGKIIREVTAEATQEEGIPF